MGARREATSDRMRKQIANHTFDNEEGEEYAASRFGEFGEYFRHKKIKLQNSDAGLRAASSKPPIFSGVVAHVNGYTQPSQNELHRMIVSHGGGFIQYLDGKMAVTHIIATNLTPRKRVEFRHCRVVKPAWVVDSISAGRLLPWDTFRLLDEGPGQRVLGFDNGNIISQVNKQSSGYKEQSDKSQFFNQDITKDGTATQSLEKSHIDGVERHGEDVKSDSFKTSTSTEISEVEPKTYVHMSPIVDSGTSAEEHNARLLADPKIWKSTVVNPDFLKQYYQESRLHHLSTWKADLKAKMQALTSKSTTSQKARPKRAAGSRRYILHVDFDSFFAAVSLKKYPQYLDKPVAVAHGGGAGSEIASCNYPARKFGIKNGMWLKSAQALCPNLRILNYDFDAYEKASRSFYDAVISTGGPVQSVSIDEALIDATDLCVTAGGSDGRSLSESSIFREQAKAQEIGEAIRDTVRKSTGCEVSVGIGNNILLARVALRKAKPAGLYQLKPEAILDFLGELVVQDLPGVAYSIGRKLEEVGVKYVKDIRQLTKERLVNILGPKTGEKLWDYSRGIDRTEFGEQPERKSVSAEVNYGVRFANQQQAEDFMRCLCEELSRRLEDQRVKGRQLTLKIMHRAANAPLDPPKHLGHGECDVFNKSIVLGVATNDKEILGKEAISILRGFKFSPGELRGIGLQMTKLEPINVRSDRVLQNGQKTLQFHSPTSKRSGSFKRERSDDIFRGGSPVKKRRSWPYSDFTTDDNKALPKSPVPDDDPIVDFDSPIEEKNSSPRIVSVTELNNNSSDDEDSTLLNTRGTQFILPSQADPKVLAELPQDIRVHLRRQQQRALSASQHSRPQTPKISRSQPPIVPPQSQLDPTTLAELPEDIRAEILAAYEHPSHHASRPGTPLKSQFEQPPPVSTSPNHPLTLYKQTTQPKRHNRRHHPRYKSAFAIPTLTQTNFITLPPNQSLTGTLPQSIDPSFLAAIPLELRSEVLNTARLISLQPKTDPFQNFDNTLKKKCDLPKLPPKPTFTQEKISELGDLRPVIREWVKEFEKEGPYKDDVESLVEYLEQVTKEEKNIEKVGGVVRWLDWCVGGLEGEGKKRWTEEVKTIKERVGAAGKERGLGEILFE